jgi:glycosyltransferase involved in cell wall biosynthesis
MKITFILPAIGICGGVRSTFELANRLQQRGHDVRIVHSFTPSTAAIKRRNIAQLKTTLRNIIKGTKYGIESEVTWFDLKATLMRVPTLANRYIPKSDVIVATWWENAYDVAHYSEDKGKKFYFIRSYETWGGPADLVDKSYTLPLKKIAVSYWLKDFIEGKFNVSVLGPLANGVNFDLFYKEKQFNCHHPKRVGMLFRNQEIKGMRDGLDALLMAKEKYRDVTLVLFGERPEGEEVKIINEAGEIEFHEMPYKDKLRHIYSSLDIFVCPSHMEGYAVPPMEAMACGAACVVTDVGAVRDYTIPDKTALVSQPKDTETLAKNIIELLEDEQKRKIIAENGYNHIKQFTWNKTVTTLEKLFEAACVGTQ